jgi:hypothetical protein
MRLRLDLDPDVSSRLTDVAAAERRPIPWQAEVILRRALGLSGPPPDGSQELGTAAAMPSAAKPEHMRKSGRSA